MSTEFENESYYVLPPAPPQLEDNSIIYIIEPSKLLNNFEESYQEKPECIEPEPSEEEINRSEYIYENTSNDFLLFEEGKFDYINNKSTREMLINAWNSITQLELWNYMKNDTDSYMFNNDKEVYLIGNKMIELGYNGHSGCSFGWTMRQMQYIAKNGERQYANEIILQNN